MQQYIGNVKFWREKMRRFFLFGLTFKGIKKYNHS
jgi:hypothetical protein